MAEIHTLARDELLPPKPPERRHLISIADLERDDVERLLTLAGAFAATLERDLKKLPTLRGRTVVNLFYESSTRTSSSFELAAKRLSADVMSIKSTGSAVDKGESLKDTSLTIGCYDPDVIVIRHPEIGAPELVAKFTDAHIVNAGDGKRQHPTQALLDLYTIVEEFGIDRPARRDCTSRSSGTSCIRGSRARTSRRSCSWARRSRSSARRRSSRAGSRRWAARSRTTSTRSRPRT